MVRILACLGLLVVLVARSLPANAIAVLDLTSGACHNQFECTLTLFGENAGGIQATFSSPEVSFGNDDFYAYSDGMIFGNGVFPHAFDLSFDQSVQWQGGALELEHRFSGFDVTGSNVALAALLSDTEPGRFTLAQPVLFQANELYRFDSTPASEFGFGVLSSLDFSIALQESSPSVVPLPASMPMMLTILILLPLTRFVHRRRQLSGNRDSRANHAIA